MANETRTADEQDQNGIAIERLNLDELPWLDNLPFPDFLDETTYNQLSSIATDVFELEEGQLPLHSQLTESTAGQYLREEIERGEVDDSGEQVLLALSQHLLYITGMKGDRINVTLARATDGTYIGLSSMADHSLPETEVEKSGLLGEILTDSNHDYWKALIELGAITEADIDEYLDSARDRISTFTILEAVHDQVRSEYQEKGIAAKLRSEQYHQASNVAAFSAEKEAIKIKLAKETLPDHIHSLMPCQDPQLKGEDKIVALALQAAQVEIYMGQYQYFVSTNHPMTEEFEQFASFTTAVNGFWNTGRPEDTTGNLEVVKSDGFTEHEQTLLTDLKVARKDGTIQLSFVSFPKSE